MRTVFKQSLKFQLYFTIGISAAVLPLVVFLSHSVSSYAADEVLRIPCGKGFLRACTDTERKTPSQEPAVIPKLVKNIQTYLKDHSAFLYNDGKDIYGNRKFFDTGKAVNLQTGEVQEFGGPTCSRCKTSFNKFNKEIRANYLSQTCGRTTTTVRITSNGSQFINFGEDAEAWYRGIYTMVLNRNMNHMISEIKRSRTIAYAPGCKSMALKTISLIQESTGPLEQLQALLGKTGEKEKEMSEKDFDQLLLDFNPEMEKHSVLGIDKKSLNERPDQGRLRQLAQHLKSLILNTEALIGEVALCSIADRTGVEFRKNFGKWEEFFNAQSMNYIEGQVEAHVMRECKHLFKYTTMGKAVDCANRAANQVVPKVVDDFFDRRIAGYCDNHVGSDQFASQVPENPRTGG